MPNVTPNPITPERWSNNESAQVICRLLGTLRFAQPTGRWMEIK